MGVVIAQEPLSRRYEARWWSLAACFHFACYVALVIVPFIIAYSSQSLWLKEKTGREQPEAHFQHEVLVLAQGVDPSQQYAFSTSPSVNALFGDAMRAMSVRLSETDADHDGRPEQLHVEVSLPLRAGEEVVGVTVLVALSYALQDTARFSANATAIAQHTGAGAGSGVVLFGDLELRAARALPPVSAGSSGPAKLMGVSSASTLDGLSPAALIARYRGYPTAVHFAQRNAVWLSGGGGSRFTAKVSIGVPPALVHYQPRVAETLKFAWVQYFSFFIPLWFILRQVKWFAAANQITPCRVVVDRPQVRKINDHDF